MNRPFQLHRGSPAAQVVVLALLLAAVAPAPDAAATDITVTTTDDEVNADGDCSLREAILAANQNSLRDACPAGSDSGLDTVILASGATYALTIAGVNEGNSFTGGLDVTNNTTTKDLLIKVADGGHATISQDATPDDVVLTVASNASVGLADVTIRGGTSPAGVSGGGIRTSTGSALGLQRCVLIDNVAGNNGGAIQVQGALAIEDSVVRDNVAAASGGGIATGTSTVASISRTLFQNNVATTQSGGAIRNNNVLTVTSSSFVDNRAQAIGGAIATGTPVQGSVAINGSCFRGNLDGAVQSFNDVEQDATGNWWGTADGPSDAGPGTGDGVGAAFDASDFLTSPPEGCRPQELVAHGGFEGTAPVPDRFRARKLDLQNGDGAACGADNCDFAMVGNGQRKQLLQTLDVPGQAGDGLTFSARSAATDVPATPGKYLVELQIIHADGSKQRKTIKFSAGTHGPEARAKAVVATEAYVRVKLRVEYSRASGAVRFDDVSVVLQ